MANCKNMLHAEIDLSQPVPELCQVIAHVLASWPGREVEVLNGLKNEIESHLLKLRKGDMTNGESVR